MIALRIFTLSSSPNPQTNHPQMSAMIICEKFPDSIFVRVIEMTIPATIWISARIAKVSSWKLFCTYSKQKDPHHSNRECCQYASVDLPVSDILF